MDKVTQETLLQERKALIRVMQTTDGLLALSLLGRVYGGDVHIAGDSYATHVRIGERNVIDYLKQLSEEKPNG